MQIGTRRQRDASRPVARGLRRRQLHEGRVEAERRLATDFVHDQLAARREIQVLTVVDTLSRYSPVLHARFSYRGQNEVAAPERICGASAIQRRSAAAEFISRDMDLWAFRYGVTLDFARPGEPTDNAAVEVFGYRWNTLTPTSSSAPPMQRKVRGDAPRQ